jgi:outer membrane translocation and assembly module TamA
VDYTHTNLFGNLTRLDLHTVAGYAEMPNPWDTALHGPVVIVEPTMSKKGFLEDYLVWSISPAAEIDMREGYQYWKVKGRAGLARWFANMLHLSLNYNLHFVDFFNVSATLDRKKSILGRDFSDPYVLGYLELRAELYLTDSVSEPKNGVVFEAVYDLAGKFFGSEYDYNKLLFGVRAYWKPIRWLQLALHLQTGMFLTYWNQPGVPISERFYLGGASTVRGWGGNRISPRLEETAADGSVESIPIGGYTMIQGSFETRFNIWGPAYLVAFVDMGDVQAGEHEWHPSEWNYTAGPGFRYDSPMGFVRLDAGFHLNAPGIYDEPFWSIHFGFGETF